MKNNSDYLTRKFHLVAPEERNGLRRNLSVRLYVNRFQEHRDAAEFIDEVMRTRGYGEGVETVVRALLFYRDRLYTREEANGQRVLGEQNEA